MKTKSIYLLLAVVIFIASSCGKNSGKGTVNLKMVPEASGNPVQFKTAVYTDNDEDVRYRVDNFQFYISNIKFIKDDNSEVVFSKADDVKLFLWKEYINDQEEFKIPSGNYSKIVFTLGLTPDINATEPGDYNTDKPLGANSGNYWLMSNSYIYSKFEGFIDTSNTMGATLDNSFLFHIGGDGFSKEVTIIKDFTISRDESTELPISIEFNKFWNGPSTLDLKTELQTHTLNKPDLATRFLNNFASSFSAE
jgi:hypothetical protein